MTLTNSIYHRFETISKGDLISAIRMGVYDMKKSDTEENPYIEQIVFTKLPTLSRRRSASPAVSAL